MQKPTVSTKKKGKYSDSKDSGPRTPVKSPYTKKMTMGSLYYDNMEVRYLGKMLGGKPEGEGQSFHENKEKKFEGVFKNGGPHGDHCKIYHPNKEIAYEGACFEGLKEGKGTEYYDNGQILFSGDWHYDQPVGTNIKIFMANGKVLFEGTREKGTVFIDDKNIDNESVSTQVTAESAELNKKIEDQKTMTKKGGPVKGHATNVNAQKKESLAKKPVPKVVEAKKAEAKQPIKTDTPKTKTVIYISGNIWLIFWIKYQ